MPDLIIISTRSDPIYFHQIIQISTCYVKNVFNTFEIPAALAFLPLITILTIFPAAGITQELVSNPDVSLLHSSSLTCLNCPSSSTWTLRTYLLDYICSAVSSRPNPKQRTMWNSKGLLGLLPDENVSLLWPSSFWVLWHVKEGQSERTSRCFLLCCHFSNG